jgi:signal transduction histidine kinase
VCVGVDLTNRKLIEDLHTREEAILQANKLLRRIVTTISHEFRTPFSILKMSASTLSKYEKELTQKQREESLELITSTVSTLTELIDEVTTLTKIQEEKLLSDIEEYLPSKVIEMNLLSLNHKIKSKELVIKIEISEKIRLMGNTDKINQIFKILIENAIDSSPQFGEITIRAQDHYKGEYNEGNQKGILFQIGDKGPGIHPDDLPFVFERFYKPKDNENIPGLGLKFVIARELVLMHQGNIYIDSKYQEGSTISIFLPYLLEDKLV